MSKHTYNKNIWNELTPESCYWAGFVAADGCLVKINENYNFAVDISIKDIDHLEKLKNFCGYDGDIKIINKKDTYIEGRKIKKGALCGLRVSSGKNWGESLKRNFSIVPNKTKILKPPSVKDEFLIECFIIGFICGDGHITYSLLKNGKNPFLTLGVSTASPYFREWIFECLNKKVENSSVYKRKRKIRNYKDKVGSVHICGLPAAVLVDYFRKFPVPKLDRKWNQPEILEYIEAKKTKIPR